MGDLEEHLDFLNAVQPLVIFSTIAMIFSTASNSKVTQGVLVFSGVMFIATILYAFAYYKSGKKDRFSNKASELLIIMSFSFLFLGLIFFLIEKFL